MARFEYEYQVDFEGMFFFSERSATRMDVDGNVVDDGSRYSRMSVN